MNFLVITHVVHTKKDNQYFAYAPYVNEMNVWFKYVDKVTVIAPLKHMDDNPILNNYIHQSIQFVAVPEFSFTTPLNCIKSFFIIPYIFFKIITYIFKANHIHLRCPGNMGLLGSIAQIGFPKKIKSAKYAGNWDAKSNQPLSYKLQKYILKNTFLTHNIKVLVYGKWQNQTKNIKDFFTATYSESDKIDLNIRNNTAINFIFVGSLTQGKRPIYAIELVEKLKEKGFNVKLDLYGEGFERNNLFHYISQKNLAHYIELKGNISKEQMKVVYQKSHFLLLPSKSEGWPKVVAESMFWGCLPVATPISCVPNMIDFGNRGILLSLNLNKDVDSIVNVMQNQTLFNQKMAEAVKWSREYTIDKFDSEIKKILLS